MGRNSSKSVSAVATVTEISSKKVTTMNSNVLTMERPVTRIALEAAQYALEAAYYPVDDTMSGGYSLDSGLNAPVTVYDPSYQPATPHKIIAIVPAETATAPSLLAPYFAVQVKLTYRAPGMDYDLCSISGLDAVERAQEIANAKKFNVHIRDMTTGAVIQTISPNGNRAVKATATGTRKVSGGTSVKSVSGPSAEEIARKAEEKRLAAVEKAEEAHSILITNAYNAAVKMDLARNLKIAEDISAVLALKWNKPAFETEEYYQFMTFFRVQGATPKEQNLAWDIRNNHGLKKANFGWKQIAEKFVTRFTGYILLQTSRPDESTTGENRNVLRPAFRIAEEGTEIPAGWYNITPTK